MRKLVTALCALVFLSSCDDELKLVSRDFSVTLKSIDGNTAVVGKPINCTLTISDLDPDNGVFVDPVHIVGFIKIVVIASRFGADAQRIAARRLHFLKYFGALLFHCFFGVFFDLIP